MYEQNDTCPRVGLSWYTTLLVGFPAEAAGGVVAAGDNKNVADRGFKTGQDYRRGDAERAKSCALFEP
ncbi:hypothetical protein ACG3SL_10545 [Sphingomonas sp. CJ20]